MKRSKMRIEESCIPSGIGLYWFVLNNTEEIVLNEKEFQRGKDVYSSMNFTPKELAIFDGLAKKGDDAIFEYTFQEMEKSGQKQALEKMSRVIDKSKADGDKNFMAEEGHTQQMMNTEVADRFAWMKGIIAARQDELKAKGSSGRSFGRGGGGPNRGGYHGGEIPL